MSPTAAMRKRSAVSSTGYSRRRSSSRAWSDSSSRSILPGRINSLAQTLIKMVAPGVPDFYQGTELWDLSLVDPDNRRPVDFELRRAADAARARMLSAPEVLAEWDSGLPKLWMTARLLAMRRERAGGFLRSEPVSAAGRAGHASGTLACFSARRESHRRRAALHHDTGRRVGRYAPAAARRAYGATVSPRRSCSGRRLRTRCSNHFRWPC